MKATITLPDGTRIEAEGTPEEILQLLPARSPLDSFIDDLAKLAPVEPLKVGDWPRREPFWRIPLPGDGLPRFTFGGEAICSGCSGACAGCRRRMAEAKAENEARLRVVTTDSAGNPRIPIE